MLSCWCSSLGKPRRFSEQFLKEEKEKLNQYRDSVRTHYTELRAGTREGLPTDLAPPLSVGQRVVALHPRTREIHDGKVLTVDRTWCRVQFERPELGVELVMVMHFLTDTDYNIVNVLFIWLKMFLESVAIMIWKICIFSTKKNGTVKLFISLSLFSLPFFNEKSKYQDNSQLPAKILEMVYLGFPLHCPKIWLLSERHWYIIWS